MIYSNNDNRRQWALEDQRRADDRRLQAQEDARRAERRAEEARNRQRDEARRREEDRRRRDQEAAKLKQKQDDAKFARDDIKQTVEQIGRRATIKELSATIAGHTSLRPSHRLPGTDLFGLFAPKTASTLVADMQAKKNGLLHRISASPFSIKDYWKTILEPISIVDRSTEATRDLRRLSSSVAFERWTLTRNTNGLESLLTGLRLDDAKVAEADKILSEVNALIALREQYEREIAAA